MVAFHQMNAQTHLLTFSIANSFDCTFRISIRFSQLELIEYKPQDTNNNNYTRFTNKSKFVWFVDAKHLPKRHTNSLLAICWPQGKNMKIQCYGRANVLVTLVIGECVYNSRPQLSAHHINASIFNLIWLHFQYSLPFIAHLHHKQIFLQPFHRVKKQIFLFVQSSCR